MAVLASMVKVPCFTCEQIMSFILQPGQVVFVAKKWDYSDRVQEESRSTPSAAGHRGPHSATGQGKPNLGL